MGENFNEVFARRLRFHMELYNMKQKDLALRMGVSEASVHNWLTGEKVPRADKVDKLCQIFRCNRSDLVEEPNEVSPLTQEHLSNYARLHPEYQPLVDELISALQSEEPNTARIGEVFGKIFQILQT